MRSTVPSRTCVFVLSFCTAVQAQVANDQADAGFQIEEILVTAQRRSENVQDVPISVSVMSGQDLALWGITDTVALSAAVPGLQITSQLGENTATIRGVGTSATAIEGAVATYIDGVYLPSQGASLMLLDNVERVEVLKGPQGTLFGRNSTGGVIQIVTRNPSFAPTMDASVGYGNYGTVNTSFYASIGVTDNLAADIAFVYLDQGDGWGHDLNTGVESFRQSSYAIRSKWLWKPDSDTTIVLAVDNSRIRSDVGLGFHPVPGSIGVDGTTAYQGYYNNEANFNEVWYDKQSGAMLRGEHSFSGFRLTTITSYRDAPEQSYLDQDATPVPVVNAGPLNTKDRTFSQEVQLASEGNRSFNWVTGLYFFRDRTGANPFHIGGLFAAPLPYVAISTSLPTDSYAAYVQTSYRFTSTTQLTTGLRYTRDYKSISGSTYLPGVGTVDDGTESNRFDKLTWRLALDQKFSDVILGYLSYNRGFKSGVYEIISPAVPAAQPEVVDAFEAGVKTEFLDHRMRLNAAAYYYDYKDIQIEEDVVASTVILNAARATIYGVDIDFGAALTQKWSVTGAMALIHGRYNSFPNAPAFLPVAAIPSPGVTCLSAVFPGGNKTCSIADGDGLTTVKSPKFTSTISTDYRIPLKNGSVHLNLNYTYNSGYSWNVDQRLQQPAYNLVVASIGWETLSRHFGIRLWGKNLLDEHFALVSHDDALGDLASPSAPRTFGVTVTLHY